MNGVVIHVIETPSLGDRTYVVHDGTVAFVIDPQRDIGRTSSLSRSARTRSMSRCGSMTKATVPSWTT